jgi:hypothetical protein
MACTNCGTDTGAAFITECGPCFQALGRPEGPSKLDWLLSQDSNNAPAWA